MVSFLIEPAVRLLKQSMHYFETNSAGQSLLYMYRQFMNPDTYTIAKLQVFLNAKPKVIFLLLYSLPTYSQTKQYHLSIVISPMFMVHS